MVWTGKKRACKRPLPEFPLSMILAKARANDAALLSGRVSPGSRGPRCRCSASRQCFHLSSRAPFYLVSPAQLVICRQEWYPLASEASLLEAQPCLHDLLMPGCCADIL